MSIFKVKTIYSDNKYQVNAFLEKYQVNVFLEKKLKVLEKNKYIYIHFVLVHCLDREKKKRKIKKERKKGKD